MKLRLATVILVAGVGIFASSMGGRQSSVPAPTITAMVEVSGTTSYLGETSHVERVTFQMPSATGSTGGYIPGGATAGASGATTGGATSTTSTATTTGTTTGTTGSGTTGPFSTINSVGYYFYVANTSGFDYMTDDSTGATATASTIVVGTPPGTSYSVYGMPVNPSDNCTLRITPTSQTVTAIWYLTENVTTYYLNSSGMVIDSTTQNVNSWYVTNYAVSRTTATATAVDSRLAFGQPNMEGTLPGDANAPALNVVFYPWSYNGGLFAGNVDFLNGNDSSGTARVEIEATFPTTTQIVFEAATLLSVGTPPQFTTPANLTGYLVGSGVSEDFSGATWANAWPITGAPSSPAFDFTAFPTPEYANFDFGGGNSSNLISIASSNESSVISGHTSMWQYFANSTYIGALTSAGSTSVSSLPLSDPLPRIWLADQTSQTSAFSTSP